MTETKPKIERKRHSKRPARNAGPARKQFVTKVLGLESHTFDIGSVKYALLPTTSRRSTREDQRLQRQSET